MTLKFNKIYQILVYVRDINLLRDNINAVNKDTETDAGKEVELEANAEKTMYMLLSRHQKAGQNHDIKIGNRSFENVARFTYLGTTVTNHILIQEEVKKENEFQQCFFPLSPEPSAFSSAA
jgi:hypothetical protein